MCLTALLINLDKKFDILKEENSNIKKELIDLRKSFQYHFNNGDEVNKKLEDIKSTVEEIKWDEITEDFVAKTKKKLADLEDRSCRNNLRFDGFEEETNETWEESKSIITDFVNKKFRNCRGHHNWKGTSHGEDTENWTDKK